MLEPGAGNKAEKSSIFAPAPHSDAYMHMCQSILVMEPTCPIQLPKSPQTRMCRVFPRLPVSACFKLSAILSFWHFGICCSCENVNLKRHCKIHGKNEGGQREASFSHSVNKCRVLWEDSVCEKFHISFVSAVNTRWTFAKIEASWAGQKKTIEAKTRRAAVTRASPICKNLICIVKIFTYLGRVLSFPDGVMNRKNLKNTKILRAALHCEIYIWNIEIFVTSHSIVVEIFGDFGTDFLWPFNSSPTVFRLIVLKM